VKKTTWKYSQPFFPGSCSVMKNCDLQPMYRLNSQMVQHMAIVTTGTRMRSIKWCHFQWLWVTPNLNFKVVISNDILQLQITQKWCKVELYLQMHTDRKSYVVYQILRLSPTLNDPKHKFQKACSYDILLLNVICDCNFDLWLSIF